jgi:hypothetical protein
MASAQYEIPPWQRGKCITEHQSRFMRKTTLKEISKKNLSKIISDNKASVHY